MRRVFPLIVIIIWLAGCSAVLARDDSISAIPTQAVAATAGLAISSTEATSETAVPSPIAEAARLEALPLLPTISERTRQIYQDGLAHGHNPHVFTKVGDCLSASDYYLKPISMGHYDLGEYTYLQDLIDSFGDVTIREVEGQPVNSFSNPSLAASCGFNSAGPLDPIWANPNLCQDGETPLLCELRISNASFALIILGTHDMYYTVEKYEGYLRQIVEDTISAGVVPILFTFPTRLDLADQVPAYNQVSIRLAADYEIPIGNLWLALRERPNYGVASDHMTRMSMPEDGCTTCFTEENLTTGGTVQNLIVLQTLYTVWQEVSR